MANSRRIFRALSIPVVHLQAISLLNVIRILYRLCVITQIMNIVKDYIEKKGGKICNATLAAIYVDRAQPGGIAEYVLPDGEKQFIAFDRAVLSLGRQKILDENNTPVFNTISARGVSALA